MRSPIWMTGEQGTVEWLKERCGCLTASRMGDAMDFGKGGKESAARRKYKIDLIAERMTDTMVSRYVTKEMEWGIEQEPFARERYEEITGNLVMKCGFAIHAEIPYFGASPDGLIGEDGQTEIKCPTTSKFLEWRSAGVVPEEHKPQMISQLAVTGRKWCDFVAFDPRIKVWAHQHFIRRFEPPEEDIVAVEKAAVLFLEEVDALFDQITRNGDAA